MTASPMHPLLIELGTEELPVKALPGLAQSLFDGVLAALDKRGVAVERGDAKPLYSPRRLAVLLPGVATEQPEQTSEVLGPYLNIALDADGQPTKALQGFAAKAGVDWTQLQKTSDAKGERFVHRATTPGARTLDLLQAVLDEAMAGMPIPPPMRWGAHAYGFARPLHWLVALLGDDVANVETLGIRAGRETRGHRFHHVGNVTIARPLDYVETLRGAQVLVDPDERRARIIEEVETAARVLNGNARIDADNLAQVNCLNEWPVAVTCAFERDFLQVPQEALVATMETNQKFFPVLDADGRLTEHFIGIANIASKDPGEIRKGYERVIRPRFADAKFFFDEDLKQGLDAMGDGLKTVTYQAKLGSVADKVARVAALAEAIAPQVGVDPVLAGRAAALAKNDLQSRMVNEFPELQGIAGRYYAQRAGEPAEVSLAIDEAYQPRFAGDDIALSGTGKVLAIAERKPTSLYDFDRRIDAIGTFAQLPEAAALAAANKRIGNILKKVEGEIPNIEDHTLLSEPAELALAEAVEAVYGETGHALAHGDYADVLVHLARLRPQVDAFFDSVMVNVDDAAIRNNRLALLKRLADRLGSVAAIEHLSN